MTSPERPTAVVVNDDPSQLALAARILEQEGGLRVFSCTSAREALVVMNGQRTPDLIVTDLHMPGIDGWQFCRLLRSPECAALNQVPILVLSATYSGADVQRITAELGAIAFLAIPYHRSTLLTHVREILEGRTPRASKTAMIVSEDLAQFVPLERAFTRHGYTCWVAENDEEGIRLLREAKPDIAVLCIRYPDQSRELLLEETNKPGSSTIAIVIIADPIAVRAIDLMEKGADVLLRAPFEAEDMIALCEQALRERSLMRVGEVLEERTQELRSSEIKYRLLLDSIGLHVIAFSDELTVLYCNLACSELVGKSSADLEGRHLLTLLPDVEGAWLFELCSKSLETRETQAGEGKLGDRYLQAHVYRTPSGILMVAEDITERKRMEEQLLQSNRLESIGRLAGGVAHEFNNLLTPILGYAQLGISELQPGHSVRIDLEVVHKAAQQASKIASQLLAFSRRQISEPTEVDINQLIMDMKRLFRSAIDENVELVMLLAPGMELVRSDPSQIEQVLMNLVINARDAMPEGGKLDIVTAQVAVNEPQATQWTISPGNYVLIAVSDNGIGMHEDVKLRAFEPFFTTKEPGKGTGLGLSTCYGIIKQNQGHILVNSAPGQGSTFKIYLPCSTRQAPELSTVEELVNMPSGKETILLAEDEPLVRSMCTRLLRDQGYTVLVANNGDEAFRLVQAYTGTNIQLLLCDIVMPQMSGMELATRLDQAHPDIKILLMSGYTDEAISMNGSTEDQLPFLAKPFLPAGLLHKVREVLDS